MMPRAAAVAAVPSATSVDLRIAFDFIPAGAALHLHPAGDDGDLA
jgi:hypothetical protein